MKRMLVFLLAIIMLVAMLAGCTENRTEPSSDAATESTPAHGMKIATTTSDFDAYTSSHEEKISFLSDSGFRYIDLSFYYDSDMAPFMQEDWLEYTNALKKHASDKNMEFVLAHAIGGNAFADDASYQHIVENTIRSIQVCKELGIPHIVVHAPYSPDLDKTEFYEQCLAFYSEFFPVMEETGVRVLIENSAQSMLQCENYFYTGEEMAAFLEYANHPLLGACWDTGHANVEGCSQYQDITALGDNLEAVHITDNFGEKDDHLMPYQGTMSIDAVMSGLVEIGYDGCFTFEGGNNILAGSSWPHFRKGYAESSIAYKPSAALKIEAEKLMYSIGVYILTQYQIEIAG